MKAYYKQRDEEAEAEREYTVEDPSGTVADSVADAINKSVAEQQQSSSGGGPSLSNVRAAAVEAAAKKLQTRPRARSRSEWSESNKCEVCDKSFSLFRQRHHCRFCCGSFCDKHSAKRVLTKTGDMERACDACHKLYGST